MPAISRNRLVLLVSGLGLVAIGTYMLSSGPAGPAMKPDHGAKSKPAAQVIVLPITASSLTNTLHATGTVLANEEVEVRSEVSGRITRILFEEGAPVKAGALLVKINDADLRADLKKLELQRDLAKREEARARQLLGNQLLSQEEYDVLLNKLETVEAQIDRVRSDIRKTEIYAPFAGTAGLRFVSEGSTVSPATLIARVQQLNPVKVEFSVPEKYSAHVRNGSHVTFKVTGSDRTYQGTVYARDPKIDLATRTLKVRARAQNPDGSLLPGSFARIELTLETIKSAIAVPTGSIIPELSGQKAYVLHEGKAVSRKVSTGIRTDSTVQITEGLGLGDTVIVSGVMQLREGAVVKAVIHR